MSELAIRPVSKPVAAVRAVCNSSLTPAASQSPPHAVPGCGHQAEAPAASGGHASAGESLPLAEVYLEKRHYIVTYGTCAFRPFHERKEVLSATAATFSAPKPLLSSIPTAKCVPVENVPELLAETQTGLGLGCIDDRRRLATARSWAARLCSAC